MSMNLNVRNCALCQKMFKYKGYDICPRCMEKVDKEYVIVRDYLYDHPGAGIQELSEETEVDEAAILHLVRTGRLVFAEGADTGIYCRQCGRPIVAAGGLCERCAAQLSKTLQGALPQREKKKDYGPMSEASRGVRMHISDRIQDTPKKS
jgi:predicted amidophosphoribosyltransferase